MWPFRCKHSIHTLLITDYQNKCQTTCLTPIKAPNTNSSLTNEHRTIIASSFFPPWALPQTLADKTRNLNRWVKQVSKCYMPFTASASPVNVKMWASWSLHVRANQSEVGTVGIKTLSLFIVLIMHYSNTSSTRTADNNTKNENIQNISKKKRITFAYPGTTTRSCPDILGWRRSGWPNHCVLPGHPSGEGFRECQSWLWTPVCREIRDFTSNTAAVTTVRCRRPWKGSAALPDALTYFFSINIPRLQKTYI